MNTNAKIAAFQKRHGIRQGLSDLQLVVVIVTAVMVPMCVSQYKDAKQEEKQVKADYAAVIEARQ